MKELVAVSDFSNPYPVNARDLYESLDIGRDFTNWIKYQIERYGFIEGADYRLGNRGEMAEQDFSPNLADSFCSPKMASKADADPRGGHNRIEYALSVNMAKHIATASNSDAGRKIREYLFAVEKAWNTDEAIMLRAFQAQQRIIARQAAELASLADDARVARNIADARGLKTVTEVAKINNVGPRKIFDLLAERKIIYRIRGDWVPMQDYIERGYFVVKERTYAGTSGSAHLSTQIYVTGKGEVWLAKQFFPVAAVVA